MFVPRQAGGPIFSENIALEALRNVLFEPGGAADFRLADLKFDAATFARLAPARALYDADNPDLSGFARRGGKLVLWHGWSDPHITPLGTIDYFERVGARMGAGARDGFVRLFLLPGVYHCNGGDGPSEFPLLASLMSWVESGAVPNEVVAHRVADRAPPPGTMGPPPGAGPPDGAPPQSVPARPMEPFAPRSRPIYAYPMVARYTGRGSIDEASNFIPVRPSAVAAATWLGSAD